MKNVNTGEEIVALMNSFGAKFTDEDAKTFATSNNLNAIALSGSLDKIAGELHQQFLDAIASGFDASPEWWETAPKWWTEMVASGFVAPSDTSSP